MDYQEELGAQKKYLNREIDEYELADLLGYKYTEIGAYILSEGLSRGDKVMHSEHIVISDLVQNDLEMIADGHKFQVGELDWYLKETDLSASDKDKINAIKQRLGI